MKKDNKQFTWLMVGITVIVVLLLLVLFIKPTMTGNSIFSIGTSKTTTPTMEIQKNTNGDSSLFHVPGGRNGYCYCPAPEQWQTYNDCAYCETRESCATATCGWIPPSSNHELIKNCKHGGGPWKILIEPY